VPWEHGWGARVHRRLDAVRGPPRSSPTWSSGQRSAGLAHGLTLVKSPLPGDAAAATRIASGFRPGRRTVSADWRRNDVLGVRADRGQIRMPRRTLKYVDGPGA
jgi:hypothetical protein